MKMYGGGFVAQSCPTLATPWTLACQAPLSMGFSRQEYWGGLPCPPPGDLPDPGIKPASPVALALEADSLPLAPPGKPHHLARPTPNSPPPPSSSESFGPSPTSANPHDGNLKLKVPSFPSSLSPGHVTPPAEGLSTIAGRHSGLLTNV